MAFRLRSQLLLLLLLMMTALSARPARAATLYGVSFNASQIYTIDVGTAATTLVGPTGLFDLAGIAFDSTGALYGIDIAGSGSTQLYVLDPIGGSSTLIGATGFPGGEGGLVYDPTSNRFYSKANVGGGSGSGGTNLALIAISPGTGAGTLIGNMGLNFEADVSGLARLPDGTLIAYDGQSALVDRLLTIDELTGVATVVGPTADTTLTAVGGLAVDPDTGKVYLTNGQNLFEVDPGTGAPTLIGPLGDIISGLAFAPPSPCIIGTDPGSTLTDYDPLTATASNPRPTGIDEIGGLALSPSGTLYALRSGPSGGLYTLDVITGAATLVGPTLIPTREGGLDFDPISGQLYGGHGNSGGDLFTLDTLTGAGTVVGTVVDEFGQSIDLSAIAFDASGTLYGLKMVTAPEIYRIDPNNANVLDRVPIPGFPPGAQLAGMDFDDSTGTLYASIEGQVVILDPNTGATTPIGVAPITSSLEVVDSCLPPPAAVSVPGLGAWPMLMLAAALPLAAWYAGRRR